MSNPVIERAIGEYAMNSVQNTEVTLAHLPWTQLFRKLS